MIQRTSAAKATLSPRRRRGASIQIICGGLLLLLLPEVLGSSSATGHGFQMLAPVGWIMLASGFFLLWRMREKAVPAPKPKVDLSWIDAGMPVVETPTPVLRPEMDLALHLGVSTEASAPANTTTPPVSRASSWDKSLFEAMEPRRFEAVVEALFQQAGFETGLRNQGAREGVDIWLYSRTRTGSPVSVVQCRHGHGEPMGPGPLTTLRQTMENHGLERGQCATTASLTPEAVAYARNNGINLLDAEGLLSLIAKRTPQQQQALLELALA